MDPEIAFYGMLPQIEEGSKRADWYSSMSSSKLEKGPSQQAGNQAKTAGSLHGRAKSS